ncbi:hypothetical protein FACS1894137_19430 [Spirochaetia bacterium]|nr:hypothetical protein FACS1894137_19430 [Spirochaetia bacterium]
MTIVLYHLGAEAMGYALKPEHGSLFEKIGGDTLIRSVIADVRDFEKLKQELCGFKPEIVIHFAALLPVQACFDNPKLAYDTHVMGTVNLFEAIGTCESVKSVLIVTSDC